MKGSSSTPKSRRVICDAIWDHLGKEDTLCLRDVQELASWTYPPPGKSERQFMEAAGERLKWWLQFSQEKQVLAQQREAFRELGYLPKGLAPISQFPPKVPRKRGRRVETRWAATCVLEAWLNDPDQPTFQEAAERLGYTWNENLRRQVQFLRATLKRHGVKLPPRARPVNN